MNMTTKQQVIREMLLQYLNDNPCSMRELGRCIGCAPLTLSLFVKGKDIRNTRALLKVIKFLESQK